MSQSFSNFHPPTLSFFIILTTSILFSPHTRTVLADNRICNLGDGVDPEFNDVQQFLSDRIISEPYPVTVNYNYELVTNWESGADKRANDVSVVETQLALLLLPKLFEECDNRNDRKTKRRAATNGSQNILYESYSVEADMLRSLEESSRIVGLSVLPKDVVDESGTFYSFDLSNYKHKCININDLPVHDKLTPPSTAVTRLHSYVFA